MRQDFTGLRKQISDGATWCIFECWVQDIHHEVLNGFLSTGSQEEDAMDLATRSLEFTVPLRVSVESLHDHVIIHPFLEYVIAQVLFSQLIWTGT